jgi:hypothetical protein
MSRDPHTHRASYARRTRTYICMYLLWWSVRVWLVLCVLYAVRVGFLTSVVAWRSIPLSKRRVTVLARPLEAARWRALRPSYSRDTQTDRRRLATQGHTDRQPMPREPHKYYTPGEQAQMYVLRIYELSTNKYVCMYEFFTNETL